MYIFNNKGGQMYNITVESNLFKGKSLVQQHQMVTACISDEIKNIHGYNLKTKPSEENGAENNLSQ
jgi:stress-induced morphogen